MREVNFFSQGVRAAAAGGVRWTAKRSAGSNVRGTAKPRHRLDSRRNPEGFLRSGRLKSCFGEHDFSQDFALPGRKSLRSAKQSPREALLLHPDPPLGLPGVGGGEEAVGLPGVGEGEEAVGIWE